MMAGADLPLFSAAEEETIMLSSPRTRALLLSYKESLEGVSAEEAQSRRRAAQEAIKDKTLGRIMHENCIRLNADLEYVGQAFLKGFQEELHEPRSDPAAEEDSVTSVAAELPPLPRHGLLNRSDLSFNTARATGLDPQTLQIIPSDVELSTDKINEGQRRRYAENAAKRQAKNLINVFEMLEDEVIQRMMKESDEKITLRLDLLRDYDDFKTVPLKTAKAQLLSWLPTLVELTSSHCSDAMKDVLGGLLDQHPPLTRFLYNLATCPFNLDVDFHLKSGVLQERKVDYVATLLTNVNADQDQAEDFENVEETEQPIPSGKAYLYIRTDHYPDSQSARQQIETWQENVPSDRIATQSLLDLLDNDEDAEETPITMSYIGQVYNNGVEWRHANDVKSAANHCRMKRYLQQRGENAAFRLFHITPLSNIPVTDPTAFITDPILKHVEAILIALGNPCLLNSAAGGVFDRTRPSPVTVEVLEKCTGMMSTGNPPPLAQVWPALNEDEVPKSFRVKDGPTYPPRAIPTETPAMRQQTIRQTFLDEAAFAKNYQNSAAYIGPPLPEHVMERCADYASTFEPDSSGHCIGVRLKKDVPLTEFKGGPGYLSPVAGRSGQMALKVARPPDRSEDPYDEQEARARLLPFVDFWYWLIHFLLRFCMLFMLRRLYILRPIIISIESEQVRAALQRERWREWFTPRQGNELTHRRFFDQIDSSRVEELLLPLASEPTFRGQYTQKSSITPDAGKTFVAALSPGHYYLGVTMRHLSAGFYEPTVLPFAVDLAYLSEQKDALARWLAADRLPPSTEESMLILQKEVEYFATMTGLNERLEVVRTELADRLKWFGQMRMRKKVYDDGVAEDNARGVAILTARQKYGYLKRAINRKTMQVAPYPPHSIQRLAWAVQQAQTAREEARRNIPIGQSRIPSTSAIPHGSARQVQILLELPENANVASSLMSRAQRWSRLQQNAEYKEWRRKKACAVQGLRSLERNPDGHTAGSLPLLVALSYACNTGGTQEFKVVHHRDGCQLSFIQPVGKSARNYIKHTCPNEHAAAVSQHKAELEQRLSDTAPKVDTLLAEIRKKKATAAYDPSFRINCLEDDQFVKDIQIELERAVPTASQATWLNRVNVPKVPSKLEALGWSQTTVTCHAARLLQDSTIRQHAVPRGVPIDIRHYLTNNGEIERANNAVSELCQGLQIDSVHDYLLAHPKLWHDKISRKELDRLQLGELVWAHNSGSDPAHAVPIDEWQAKQARWKKQQAVWSLEQALE